MVQRLITRKGSYDNGKFNIGCQFSLEVNQHPVTFKQLKFSQNMHKMKRDDEPPTIMKKCATPIKKSATFMKKHFTMNLFQKKCYSFEKHLKNCI
jgi:hypothetical protein